jgi:hypothetical protein
MARDACHTTREPRDASERRQRPPPATLDADRRAAYRMRAGQRAGIHPYRRGTVDTPVWIDQ